MQHVRRVDVLQTAEDLVYEGLEVCVGEGLTGTDDGCQIALHQLCGVSAVYSCSKTGACRTLVQVAFVEVVWAGYVHVVKTGDLCDAISMECEYESPRV